MRKTAKPLFLFFSISLALLVFFSLSAPVMALSGSPTAIVCGTAITTSTTLHHNLGPCPADGIDIGTSSVTLNCNGFKIIGADGGIGVHLTSHGNIFHVVVKRCTITGFDIGSGVFRQGLMFGCNDSAIVNNHVLNSKFDGIEVTPNAKNYLVYWEHDQEQWRLRNPGFDQGFWVCWHRKHLLQESLCGQQCVFQPSTGLC